MAPPFRKCDRGAPADFLPVSGRASGYNIHLSDYNIVKDSRILSAIRTSKESQCPHCLYL